MGFPSNKFFASKSPLAKQFRNPLANICAYQFLLIFLRRVYLLLENLLHPAKGIDLENLPTLQRPLSSKIILGGLGEIPINGEI